MSNLAELQRINAECTRAQRRGHWRTRLVWWLRDRGWYRAIILTDRLFGPRLWP